MANAHPCRTPEYCRELGKRHKAKPFESYIAPDPNSGCWLWVGAKYQSGRGYYSTPRPNRKNVIAYAETWRRCRGDIPIGYELHHKCRNPRCVNPDHLELVVISDHRRMHSAERRDPTSGRFGPARGSL